MCGKESEALASSHFALLPLTALYIDPVALFPSYLLKGVMPKIVEVLTRCQEEALVRL